LTKLLIIAIDGPAGSGKSTTAKALARRLSYKYLDTGALYRAMAWTLLEKKVDLNVAADVEQCCEALEMRLSLKGEVTEVFVDGVDVTPYLRRPEVTRAASSISALPSVRKKLLSIQRSLGTYGGLVVEGRDIATVVFPDAEIKFFLNADITVRGSRRNQDLESAGLTSDSEVTKRNLSERDEKDRNRLCAPLKQAEDAIFIDSTFLSVEEVVELMFQKSSQVISSRSNRV